jgi:D-threo-aldose 1-dehydrogenase
VRAIDDVCQGYSVRLAAAALHYVLRNPAVTAVVVGARSDREARENVANLLVEVPDALFDDLRERGLVGEPQGLSS